MTLTRTDEEREKYGRHLAAAVRDALTGPLGNMLLDSNLTPELLREGADRCEADARFRRALANQLEAKDRERITVREAIARRKAVS
jgi:hypothetical protein